MANVAYPKRLIEVDLPIKRISAHARREKSIRHGHISTLHIWWARRPLAACRAVICAALWPDPADPLCPQAFRNRATKLISDFARKATSDKELSGHCSEENMVKWAGLCKAKNHLDPKNKAHWNVLRYALLDFIADFANWDSSTVREYLDTSRALTQAAHEALGGAPGTRPLVVDPFCGGGSIPLEALRVGADAFASDLNPVAVLLNKVVLEYIPKYGQRLADEVRKWGAWIKSEAEKELAEFYPKDKDGATPIAYLWARTIKCEGPGCGAEVPLIRSLYLAKKANRSVALQLVPRSRVKRVDLQMIVKQHGGWAVQGDPKTKIKDPTFDGTVKRGSATCPCCGYTTPVARVREQLKAQRGGANSARMLSVILTRQKEQGRSYRLPTTRDLKAVTEANSQLQKQKEAHRGPLSLVPDEKLDIRGIRHTWSMIYGFESWDTCYSSRQLLALIALQKRLSGITVPNTKPEEQGLENALKICLALAVSRQTDYTSSLCSWHLTRELIGHTFARQALPMVWDFAEVNPFSGSAGHFQGAVDWVRRVCQTNAIISNSGTVQQASATQHPLPSDAANLFITDPPYYDAVPYAYLSDYFYVWLRRSLKGQDQSLFAKSAVPKDEEIVVDRPHELSNSTHDIAFYECELTKAFAEGRRVLRPDGIGTVVFASKTTASWEAILKAVIDAGWIITGSWPIDTEMEARVAAQGQARLASSVHLVCRPRENPDGSVRTDEVGDWRDVLAELPRRIHQWMPRLAKEGVVGADAIFACLGPALEIFSRYSRVEKGDEAVTLKEYLEHVWAAVAKEALAVIFAGADATGFEENARLTAMWLWTLTTGAESGVRGAEENEEEEEGEEEDEKAKSKAKGGGYSLEYDAARKIAQGLGAHLEDLQSVVEVKGDTARLLPVASRTTYLFGKGDRVVSGTVRRKKKSATDDLFEDQTGFEVEEVVSGDFQVSGKEATVLDHLHRAMILFGAGRSEALKRFLVEEGAGRDQRIWRLAQALSALYPSGTDEKRWVDGVLARKKGLGL